MTPFEILPEAKPFLALLLGPASFHQAFPDPFQHFYEVLLLPLGGRRFVRLVESARDEEKKRINEATTSLAIGTLTTPGPTVSIRTPRAPGLERRGRASGSISRRRAKIPVPTFL